MADSYQGEIVKSLHLAGFYVRGAPTIPPDKQERYKVAAPKKSEADLYVIGKGGTGHFIEVKTAKKGSLSYVNDFQEGQWEWAEKVHSAGFSIWYAIMFTGIEFPDKHPNKIIQRDLLLVPFYCLKEHRSKMFNVGATDTLRYNRKDHVARVIQDNRLAATDLFQSFFCTWVKGKGYWRFPAGPFQGDQNS